jgi:hypothetical protein
MSIPTHDPLHLPRRLTPQRSTRVRQLGKHHNTRAHARSTSVTFAPASPASHVHNHDVQTQAHRLASPAAASAPAPALTLTYPYPLHIIALSDLAYTIREAAARPTPRVLLVLSTARALVLVCALGSSKQWRKRGGWLGVISGFSIGCVVWLGCVGQLQGSRNAGRTGGLASGSNPHPRSRSGTGGWSGFIANPSAGGAIGEGSGKDVETSLLICVSSAVRV